MQLKHETILHALHPQLASALTVDVHCAHPEQWGLQTTEEVCMSQKQLRSVLLNERASEESTRTQLGNVTPMPSPSPTPFGRCEEVYKANHSMGILYILGVKAPDAQQAPHSWRPVADSNRFTYTRVLSAKLLGLFVGYE